MDLIISFSFVIKKQVDYEMDLRNTIYHDVSKKYSLLYYNACIDTRDFEQNVWRKKTCLEVDSNHISDWPAECLIDEFVKEIIMKFEIFRQSLYSSFFQWWFGSSFSLWQAFFFDTRPNSFDANISAAIEAFGAVEEEVILSDNWVNL